MAELLNWNPPIVPDRTVEYRWSVPYAIYVHEHPEQPRRWTDYAIAEIQPAECLAKHYEQSESIIEAFDAMAHELNQAFTDAIESPIWNWKNTTLRQNGSIIPPGARDIVDMGNLRDSQSMTLS